MSDLWIVDGNKRKIFSGKPGYKYDRVGPKKLCLHTTQGKSLRGAESAYKKYPPHIGCDFRTKTVHQYVPLNKASYSAKGAENDDEPMIQIEIVGYAQESHNWSDEMLQWLVDEVFFPVWQLWPYAVQGPAKGFKGEMDKEAIWASSKSPIRFSNREFEMFSGIVGHQHLPAPDNHWDPGAIDIDKIIFMLNQRIGEVSGGPASGLEEIEAELVAVAAASADRFRSIEARLDAITQHGVPQVGEVAYLSVLLGIIQSNLSPYDLASSTFYAVFDSMPTRDETLSWMDQLKQSTLMDVIDMMISLRDTSAS